MKNGEICLGTVEFEIPVRQPDGMRKAKRPGLCPPVLRKHRKPLEWMCSVQGEHGGVRDG